MNSTELADLLVQQRGLIREARVVTGFDAFVDEVICVVHERNGLDDYRRVESMSQFSELIAAAAGHSSLREIIVRQVDAGGCSINLGDGLVALGAAVETFATAGYPLHPAFVPYAQRATLHSWGSEPGRTLAYEFADGKLMFSAVAQLAEFTPQAISALLEDGAFLRACEAAGVIALTNWTLYPHMTACWRLLQQRVFGKLAKPPRLFVDLVDPSSRSAEAVTDMLDALRSFDTCGNVTLGLNQNEANILSRLSGCGLSNAEDAGQCCAQAEALRRVLGVGEVVIHARRHAVLATEDGVVFKDGPFCEAPLKSTGAGDRFNAGYVLGVLLGCPPLACLTLATATSGLYVRLGRSASFDELIGFLVKWSA